MRCARRTRGEDRADRGEGVVRLPIRGRHDAENGRSGRLLAALVRGFHNPKGSAQALASTVNIFGQPCLYCDRACPSISRSSSDRVTEPCSTPSPAPHGRHDVRGTGSSNPSPSSRQSVSRLHPLSSVEKPGFPRGCARLAWRPGRQRRAGCFDIAPTGGNISAGPYSSTAVPLMGLARMPRRSQRTRGSGLNVK